MKIEDYLKKQTFLIIENSTSMRSATYKILADLGVSSLNIKDYKGFTEALEIHKEEKVPTVIIAQYSCSDMTIFDFLKEIKLLVPEITAATKILTTNNALETTVVQAAEEEIDAYVIKPYTTEYLREKIIGAVKNFLKPTPYFQKLAEAKESMAQELWELAIISLTESLDLSTRPSLSYYYLGQIAFKSKRFEESKGHYINGLRANKINYRCLSGLLELCVKTGKNQEAYSTLLRLNKFFPLSPDKLYTGIRLAIKLDKINDIILFYQKFCELQEKTNELRKIMSTGLFFYAKTLYKIGDKHEAHDFFQKSISISRKDIGIISKIVQYYALIGEHEIASELLLNTHDTDKNTQAFHISQFLANIINFEDEDIILKAKKLISCNFNNIQVYKYL
ncbi:MAG: CheY-like chemotaxis protein, partial [Thermoproteota archaeon]